VVDSSFHAQCVNREFQRMFGYSDAQILSQPIDSLILPPDRAAEAHWIAQCLQRGEQLTLETQRRHRDGTLLDVSLSTAPLIVNGRSAAFYFVYRDISDRKRAEALNSALYRRRKSLRHSGSAAVLRRHPRHRRRTHARS
jgi:PAS domain S-box-containing protein